jgi:DNA (cytosine-5)-methyltransferase 1
LNYYNEIDPYCCRWLKNLIAAGLIPQGDVDSRDIKLVRGADLVGYAQCHFFAGIGGWSRALELASWPVARQCWTGSCPCQPFSHAGARKGFADERHLWPEWFRLIRECKPAVVLGEQVASAKLWLDAVSADLEGMGYAFGAAVLPAAGVGAPHRRERVWFAADAHGNGHALPVHAEMAGAQEPLAHPGCVDGRSIRAEPGANQSEPQLHDQRRSTDVAYAPVDGWGSWGTGDATQEQGGRQSGGGGLGADDVAHAYQQGLERRYSGVLREPPGQRTAGTSGAYASHTDKQSPGRTAEPRSERGFWDVEPDVGRVAHGVPARVAKLRALGNVIVPQVAAEFIGAYLDVAP